MTVTLLLNDGHTEEQSERTRTGGLPLAPPDFDWPHCRTCDGAMQFVAQIVDGDRVVAVFMCQNEPGLCEEWDPVAGGNRAYIFPNAGLGPVAEPEGATQLGASTALTSEESAGDSYGELRTPPNVLGQLGGEPDWIQFDETPKCPDCGEKMALVAQLEEGTDRKTALNFGGGGCGYVFACCASAAFLWQC